MQMYQVEHEGPRANGVQESLPENLSVKQMAYVLGVPEHALYPLLHAGDIAGAFRKGGSHGKWMAPRDAVLAFREVLAKRGYRANDYELIPQETIPPGTTVTCHECGEEIPLTERGRQYKIVKYLIQGQVQFLPVHRSCNPELKAEQARYKASVAAYKALLTQKQELDEKFLAQTRQMAAMQDQIERYVERLGGFSDYERVKAELAALREQLAFPSTQHDEEYARTEAEFSELKRQLDLAQARGIELSVRLDEYDALEAEHGDFVVVIEQLQQAQEARDRHLREKADVLQEVSLLLETNALYEQTQRRLETDWLAEKARREELEAENERYKSQLSKLRAFLGEFAEEER